MNTVSRQTKACQIDREIRVSVSDDFGSRTVIATVFERKHLKTKTVCTCDAYQLRRIDADFGIGFEVEKQDGEIYHVNLANRQVAYDTCSCAWGTYGHGKDCRHVEAAKQALREKLL